MRDNKIRLWDVQLKTQIEVLHGHQGNVNSIAFSPDYRMLVSGSDDYTVEVWDLQKNLAIRKYL
jgi:WD40 repeat protein